MSVVDFLGGACFGLLVGMGACIAVVKCWGVTIDHWRESLAAWEAGDREWRALTKDLITPTTDEEG